MIDLIALLATAAAAVALAALVWRRLRGPAATAGRAAARITFLTLVAIPAVLLGAHRLSNARTVQLAGEIVPRVETTRRVVALTFDDGPVGGSTQRVLAMLEREGVRATFFLNGEGIERHRDAAAAIAAAGHEIGNHTYSHPMMLGRSWEFTRRQIERTDTLIRRLGYEGPIHFRSPYGKKLLGLPLYLARTGRTNVFFDVEPETYPAVAASSEAIVAHVLERTRPGSIVLLHVMPRQRRPSLEAVPGIVRGLRERGYEFVTVSELLALREPAR